MFQTIRNAWKIDDLRRKIIYVLIILLLYRIGSQIPVPFVIPDLQASMNAMEGSILQYLNILSGGAFARATLFALGISPYITSSIVIQLLSVAIPALEKLSKEGEEGKKKLNQITRFVTVALALITAIGYYSMLKYGYNGTSYLTKDGQTIFGAVVIVACYCAGSSLVMWLSEKINENGIGNGISMILFANIVSSGPSIVSALWSLIKGQYSADMHHAVQIIIAVASVIIGIGMVLLIVFITNSERRLQVQYAKKVVGRKMYGGQSSTLPIKVNNTGVMPIIFASSIVSLPATIEVLIVNAGVKLNKFWTGFFDLFGTDSWLYAVLTLVLIIAFAYFYILISFNPVEISNNLKKNGGSIPGIRPGKPTSDYITRVLNRVTLIGAIFLGFIAVFPMVLNIISGGVMAGLAFGGSSIIIVVGVVIETAREIEGQMTMRHYRGFLE
ncbi:MAG: preprotein translocase subunit SecY [Clostridia bacterium]|nr:preprotein translocase subunit SecY [Clostridia bacterium]